MLTKRLCVSVALASAVCAAAAIAGELTASQERRCDQRDASACVRVGMAYFVGQDDLTADGTLAMRYFEKGCQLGDASGCMFGGRALFLGLGAPEDRPRGVQLCEKAVSLLDASCGAGHAYDCYVLGNMHAVGECIPQDHAEAARQYRKGCELGGVDGCVQLAGAFEYGRGVTADAVEAARWHRKACELGDSDSCARARPNSRQGKAIVPGERSHQK
jgi:uncharacterized protein